MSDVTLEQVIQLADQLNSEDREALKRHLQETAASQHGRLTLEMIKEETARQRAAGEFANAEDLSGRWAKPDLDLTEEELEAGIREFSNEWERDLDELGDD